MRFDSIRHSRIFQICFLTCQPRYEKDRKLRVFTRLKMMLKLPSPFGHTRQSPPKVEGKSRSRSRRQSNITITPRIRRPEQNLSPRHRIDRPRQLIKPTWRIRFPSQSNSMHGHSVRHDAPKRWLRRKKNLGNHLTVCRVSPGLIQNLSEIEVDGGK